MPEPDKDNQKKGDEVLRRLLKTPPDPKAGKGEKQKEKSHERDKHQNRA